MKILGTKHHVFVASIIILSVILISAYCKKLHEEMQNASRHISNPESVSVQPVQVDHVKYDNWDASGEPGLFQIYQHKKPVLIPDDELIQTALLVEHNRSSVPKIAFMFIVRSQLPLAPLWERFFHGHEGKFSIYIHASPDHNMEFEELPEVFKNRFIPSQNVTWGSMDMLDAERRLMAHALLDPSNSHMALFSESCIPLYNFEFVYEYITTSLVSFVTNIACPGVKTTWTKDLLPEVPKKIWRKGDEWKQLQRTLATIVLSDKYYYRKFKAHFGCPTCKWPKVKGFVDERYMPTLLHVKAPHLIANRTLTWVDWKRDMYKMHPPTYKKEEISASLLQKIRRQTVYWPFTDRRFPSQRCTRGGEYAPCYLFARKFAPDTLPRLLELAPVVLGIP